MSTRLENKQTIINAFTSVKSAKQTINSACKELGLANNVNSLNLQTLANIICTHAISDLPYITSNISEAYTTRTTANGLNVVDNSYAEIQSIEGDTVKCEQLLDIADVAETTTNGVTYSVENGVITLNGTCTGNFAIFSSQVLKINTNYSFSCFNEMEAPNIRIDFRLTKGGGVLYHYEFTTINFTKTLNCSNGIYTNILVMNGAVCNNLKIKPVLVEGSTAPTTFQPFFSGLKNSKVATLTSNNASGEVVDTITPNLEVGKWQKIWKASNLLSFEDIDNESYTISNGVITPKTTAAVTINLKNPITIKAGVSYAFTRMSGMAANISLRDENSNAIVSLAYYGTSNKFTTTEDVIITKLVTNGTGNLNANIKPMLVEGVTIPTVYLPYTTSSYLLDDNSEAKTFDGSETGWEYSSVYNYFYFQLTNAYLDSTAVTAISNILVVPYDNRSDDTTNILFDINSNNGTIQLRNTNLNSINALKTFLESNPITLHYQTATHTYTPIDVSGQYATSNGGTETITNDNDVYGAIATISTDFIINNNTSINAITEEEEGE